MESIPLDIWINEILPRLTYSSWLSLSESCRFLYSICRRIRNPIRMYLTRKYDDKHYKYGWKPEKRYYIGKQSGIKEGMYKEYRDSGKLLYACQYRNGMRWGKYIERRANGSIYIECSYYGDMLHGKYIEYYDKKSYIQHIKVSCLYLNGMLYKIYGQWNEDGEKIDPPTFENPQSKKVAHGLEDINI
ncbi:MORN-repeat protein [Orpheovirus IHUMI-LCC2]|uniref:MORN-repeat protein n=1 Tax=Orpheovirus IHUMI-LCC2 TaxID=2023057 RepID=A0A2I2L4R4_9VIRU|nr:MORN-repeat protein [Orpheovirus IHUMI-LCC2]SNW62523.1 MORN-repeat protein [Orpheovirus IHUMI-LCC2]